MRIIRFARFGWLLLIIGMAAGMQDGHSAYAGFVVCRTDPLMTFSNGSVVDLGAITMGTQAQITHASYTVHVPVGVKLTSINYDQSAAIEAVTVVADMPANQYAFHLVAATVAPVTVYEYATVNKTLKIGWGPSGSDVTVALSTKHR